MAEAVPAPAGRAPKDGSNLAAVIQAYMRTHAFATTADMASPPAPASPQRSCQSAHAAVVTPESASWRPTRARPASAN